MANDTLVSEEFAKKFATEKETPYTRWVSAEGLDIISSFYVPNLHTVELKPWARRGGRGVFLNHDASARPTIATSVRFRLAKSSRRSDSSMRR